MASTVPWRQELEELLLTEALDRQTRGLHTFALQSRPTQSGMAPEMTVGDTCLKCGVKNPESNVCPADALQVFDFE
jgi:hypothetical protein